MIKIQKNQMVKVSKKALTTFGMVGTVQDIYRNHVGGKDKALIKLVDGGSHVYNLNSLVATAPVPQGIHEGDLVIRRPYGGCPKVFHDRVVALVLSRTVASDGYSLVRVKIISSSSNSDVGKVFNIPANVVCLAEHLGGLLGCWKDSTHRFGLSTIDFHDFVSNFDGTHMVKEHKAAEEKIRLEKEEHDKLVKDGELPAFFMVAAHRDDKYYPATDPVNHKYAPRKKFASESQAKAVAKSMKERHGGRFYILTAHGVV